MRLKFVMICLLFNLVYAANGSELNQNLGDLMAKITKINNDLDKKQQKQKSLDSAINDSQDAINQSQRALINLRKIKDADTTQVREIAAVLPNIESMTIAIQNHVKTTIGLVYQQVIDTESASVFSGNNWQTNNRKQQYLVRILNVEAAKYKQLQTKLNELKYLNDKLNNELNRLNKQFGFTAHKTEQLKQEHQNKVGQKQALQGQIAQEKEQLSDLKHKQAVLSMLIKDIDLDEHKHKLQHSSAAKPLKTEVEALNMSPLFDRKLVKPLNTSVSIAFGAFRHGVKNNGVLYKAKNVPVFAITDGHVAYVGVLPGLGQVVVVNHGDNYMSVYAGIVPRVTKGQSISSGQVIANSGSEINQPMGGVYFELRHAGITVNPKEIVDN